jgi:CHAT domain-containing protein
MNSGCKPLDSWTPGRWPRIGPLLVALALGALAAGPCGHGGGRPLSARAELIAALGPARLIEGRLSGGFEYAPVRAGSPVLVTASSRRLREAGRRVLGRVRPGASAAVAGDRALLWVAAGRLQEASTRLEAATHEAPDDARLASDYAAVELALADQSHDPYHAWAALLAAEAAFQRDASIGEAAFNRALALEAVGIDWEARSAWRAYLAQDPHSGWAREARAHLASLSAARRGPSWEEQRAPLDAAALTGKDETVRAIAGANPQAAREYAEQDLFGAWAAASLRDDSVTARPALDRARAIGAALRTLHGDFLTADAVAAIDDATGEADKERLATLASGHDAYRRALGANLDLAASQRLLASAQRRLAQGRSPFASWAAVQSAICDFRGSRYGRSLSLLQRVEREVGDRYPSLRARALRVIGLTHAVRADYASAQTALSESARLYRQLGEVQNLVTVLTFLATTQQALGDAGASSRTRCLALRLARQLPAPPYLLVSEMAMDAFSRGQSRVALYFQDEGLRLAARTADPETLAEAWQIEAAIHHRLGRSEVARADLARAQRYLDRIADPNARRVVGGDILSISGEVASREDPRRAAELFQQALSIYRATGYHHLRAQLHQRCARSYLAAGDLDAAEAQYRAAIEQREQQRTILPEEQQRATFFEDVQPVFEEAAAFELVHRGRADSAFDYAERARSRTLLDLIAKSQGGAITAAAPAKPLDAAIILAALPADTTVIAYSVLEPYTLAWVLQRGSLRSTVLAAGKDRLGVLVESIHAEIADRRQPAGRPAASTILFQTLVAPLVGAIAPGSRLVFVADKCLAMLPFAALYDAGGQHYLIEDHPVAVAPSATALIRSLRRDADLSRQVQGKILVVGNPITPGLDALPGARREAEAIRNLYGQDCSLLTGAAATRAAVIAALAGHGIVHLANHAVIDPRSPERSKLVFASDPIAHHSGDLFMADLFGLPLKHTRLIVLAGCGTGAGRISNTEGPLSLARPFLADGVPAVVAALWNVDDEAAAGFFIAFHRRLRDGADAMSALRAAQLQLLRSADRSLHEAAAWAAFELFGGVEARGHD